MDISDAIAKMDAATLEDIRAECFAEDVELPDLAIAGCWTEDDARGFFESGGDYKTVPGWTGLAAAKPTQPPRTDPDTLPTPGAAAAAKLKQVPPLPPYKRLTQTEMATNAKLNCPGEWHGLPLPNSLVQLHTGSQFGAAWLTKAFHAAGSLPVDDAVVEITHFEALPLQGLDAQGGAGEKALLSVRYAKVDNGLHTQLFVKCPFDFQKYAYQRSLISVTYGDGDGLELMAYQWLAADLPVQTPQLYFADLSRKSSYYLLITECVQYAPRGSTADGYILDWRDLSIGQIMPKSGKYQDDRIADAHLYYYALLKAMARMAAADKIGRFDRVLGPNTYTGKGVNRDSKVRRQLQADRAASQFDSLISFVLDYAPALFGGLADRTWLQQAKREFVEMASYFEAANAYLASKPELFALSHINLQIDNAWFWRASGGEGGSAEDVELECGLLDWYNTGRAPTVGVWSGCLGGCEAELFLAHEEGLISAYSREYHKYGGPLVDPNELMLQYRLSFVSGFVNALQYIESEVLKDMPSKQEWNAVKSGWDPAVMGKWNVRCRTLAIVQSLKIYKAAPMYNTFMAWVRANPELCREPAK